MPLRLHGIIPAVATPRKSDERIDTETLAEHLDFLIQSGVHGVFVCGSAGESWALSFEQRVRIAQSAVEHVRGRVPVLVGTGAIPTAETIRLTKMAATVGADAVSVITPYFITPSQQELMEHYRRIADAADIPVVLYNLPRLTQVRVEPDTLATLSHVENIVGIKDSSGDMVLTMEYIKASDGRLSVLCGNDCLILPSLLMGGHGAVAATANIVPNLLVGIYEAFVAGDVARARELQYRVLPLRQALFVGTPPGTIKACCEILGRPLGKAAAPIEEIGEDKKEILRRVLRNIGELQ